MLTGKTKKAFEEYIHNDDTIVWREKMRILLNLERGNLRAIYAYVIDFFDSVRLTIEVEYNNYYPVDHFYIAHAREDIVNPYSFTGITRNEAQTKAIEKADELFNQKNQYGNDSKRNGA